MLIRDGLKEISRINAKNENMCKVRTLFIFECRYFRITITLIILRIPHKKGDFFSEAVALENKNCACRAHIPISVNDLYWEKDIFRSFT